MSDERAGRAAEAWLADFAAATGGEAPDPEQIEKLLRLAAVAAHSSERIAAPIACWMAGRAGLDLDEAIARAESLEDRSG